MGAITAAEWEALRVSLTVAGASLALTLPVATWIGWKLARRRFRGHGLVNVLVHLPLVMPPVALGYLLLLALGPQSPLGAALEAWTGLSLAFSWGGAVLAAALSGLPLAVRAIRLSAEAVDERLLQAGRTLGRAPFMVFFTVALPLMLPGVIAGGVLAFARGLGEFGATITFAASIPGETRTLPLALHAFLQMPGGEAAALRILVLSLVIAVSALVISETLAKRVARQR